MLENQFAQIARKVFTQNNKDKENVIYIRL